VSPITGITANTFNADPMNGQVFGKAVDRTLNLPDGATQVGQAYTNNAAASPTASPTAASASSALVFTTSSMKQAQPAEVEEAEEEFAPVVVSDAHSMAKTNEPDLTVILGEMTLPLIDPVQKRIVATPPSTSAEKATTVENAKRINKKDASKVSGQSNSQTSKKDYLALDFVLTFQSPESFPAESASSSSLAASVAVSEEAAAVDAGVKSELRRRLAAGSECIVPYSIVVDSYSDLGYASPEEAATSLTLILGNATSSGSFTETLVALALQNNVSSLAEVNVTGSTVTNVTIAAVPVVSVDDDQQLQVAKDETLSTGDIAGIALGGAIFLGLLCSACLYVCYRYDMHTLTDKHVVRQNQFVDPDEAAYRDFYLTTEHTPHGSFYFNGQNELQRIANTPHTSTNLTPTAGATRFFYFTSNASTLDMNNSMYSPNNNSQSNTAASDQLTISGDSVLLGSGTTSPILQRHSSLHQNGGMYTNPLNRQNSRRGITATQRKSISQMATSNPDIESQNILGSSTLSNNHITHTNPAIANHAYSNSTPGTHNAGGQDQHHSNNVYNNHYSSNNRGRPTNPRQSEQWQVVHSDDVDTRI
jgi:hypothetical protein